jgi:glycosyltransferase involved in cell wall biosynthesis
MNPNKATSIPTEKNMASQQSPKPLVSMVVPAYNEENIIEQSLSELCQYMESLENEYRWELIVVNDGSTDRTGELAEAFAQEKQNVHVFHHPHNFRLGQALRFGFNQCRGDYVVTLDLDLSYSPDHIEKMLTTLRATKAKIVLASPYMQGGKVSNVPWLRKEFSIWANRFLSLTVTKDRLTGRLSTLTGMVRAYDGKFLSRLILRAMDVDINTEILYKALILRAHIVEIPAHLNWKPPEAGSKQRKSSMRILKAILANFVSGFMFRPFMFFILPGLVILMLSLYPIAWTFIHTFIFYQKLPASSERFDYRFSEALAQAFHMSPNAFIVGGITLIVAIQLISLGILALQKKKYFEELFYLGSRIYRCIREDEKNGCFENPDAH